MAVLTSIPSLLSDEVLDRYVHIVVRLPTDLCGYAFSNFGGLLAECLVDLCGGSFRWGHGVHFHFLRHVGAAHLGNELAVSGESSEPTLLLVVAEHFILGVGRPLTGQFFLL